MDDSHFNKNLPCAVSLKVTSDSPSEAEVIQVALVPLNKFFEPSADRLPLWIHIRPEDDYPNGSIHDPFRKPRYDFPVHFLARDKDLKASIEMGVSYEHSLTLIEGWFSGLRLGQHKKLIPLSYGYGYLLPFMLSWLGYRTYDDIFDWHYRDPFPLVSYDLDKKFQRSQEHRWRKLDMTSVLGSLEVDGTRELDVMCQATDMAALYRKLMTYL